MNDQKILAIIGARGGSKGIPRKNIRMFAGKPLIAHAIDIAKASSYVDRIVVSTDDQKIAQVAREHGADVPVMRPTELARDTSSLTEAVIHMVDYLHDSEAYNPSHVLLLQPTSPMREVSDIENAVKLLNEHGGDSLVSMCRTENGLFTMDADNVVETVYDGYKDATNRQSLPTLYKLDGCMIYLIKTDILRRERSFLGGKLIGYEIERWRAVDLDDPQDFVVGELIYQNRDTLKKAVENFS